MVLNKFVLPLSLSGDVKNKVKNYNKKELIERNYSMKNELVYMK